MKVLHLSESDLAGGAARASYRLHKTLFSQGINSHMLVQRRITDDDSVHSIVKSVPDKIKCLAAPVVEKLPLFFYPHKSDNIYWNSAWLSLWNSNRLLSIIRQYEVISLYWTCGGFLSTKNIAHLFRSGKPYLWRLSDMWPFTGGCHYSGSCRRYEENCGKCPLLGSSQSSDLSSWTLTNKHKWWRDRSTSNIIIICPSQWIANCARNSSLFRNTRIEVIPSGVDINIFKPVDKTIARKILNLPLNKPLILFGAINPISDQRKGYRQLTEALSLFAKESFDDTPEVIIMGSWARQQASSAPLKFIPIGKYVNDFSLPIIYSACDAFISPSIEENLPNTVIESLACGTPVVAFYVGGLSDIICHKENGYLASYPDTNDLAAGIKWVLSNSQSDKTLSQHARQTAVEKFNISNVARRYIELYEELLNT